VLLVGASGCWEGDEKDVGAVEDLMREHGVIRRAILVYRAMATGLRAGTPIDRDALRRTATLLHDFGEDYHERELEETYLFPKVKRAGGQAAAYVDVLLEQHRKGREITKQLLGPATASDQQLAVMLDAFELMYQHHAAREDTIVFPAWKRALSRNELAEMGEKFEDIEKKRFGEDGFERAIREIEAIEQSVGLVQIAQFTPG
jgi:hemerythrin-like domain-containing protein